MNFWERLKTRPEHERKHIALGSTIVLFALTMGLWLVVESVMSPARSGVSARSLMEPFRAIIDVIKNNPTEPSSGATTTPLVFSSPSLVATTTDTSTSPETAVGTTTP
ncbi:MAG: hypothetical protein ACYC8S_00150 [Minisyncoccota bacterium]